MGDSFLEIKDLKKSFGTGEARQPRKAYVIRQHLQPHDQTADDFPELENVKKD